MGKVDRIIVSDIHITTLRLKEAERQLVDLYYAD
jgi:hypothetical protein